MLQTLLVIQNICCIASSVTKNQEYSQNMSHFVKIEEKKLGLKDFTGLTNFITLARVISGQEF